MLLCTQMEKLSIIFAEWLSLVPNEKIIDKFLVDSNYWKTFLKIYKFSALLKKNKNKNFQNNNLKICF